MTPDSPLLWLVLLAKAVIEVCVLLLLVRGLLAVVSGAMVTANPVWQLLRRLTAPAERVARALSPAVVLDKHMPVLALVLCLWCWMLLVVAKVALVQ